MTKKTLDMTGQLWRPITRQPLSHESVAALAAGGFSSGGQGAHSYLWFSISYNYGQYNIYE